jgi:hypothetical protein
VLLLGGWQAYRQLHIAREGQITERFTRAVDQLGSDTLDVRLGGIYALARVARDSPEDEAAALEVLAHYVREHAPWPPRHPGQYRADAPLDQIRPLQARAADVHAALTVLTRHPRRSTTPPPELTSTDLRRAALEGAHLERARLDGVHLEGAELRDVHLEGAQLTDAHLDKAQLTDAHLEEARLGRASLKQAELGQAHLERASLFEAHLERAWLDRAHLERAALLGAHLELRGSPSTRLWGEHGSLARA